MDMHNRDNHINNRVIWFIRLWTLSLSAIILLVTHLHSAVCSASVLLVGRRMSNQPGENHCFNNSQKFTLGIWCDKIGPLNIS